MAADSRHGVILKSTMAARPTAIESFAQARQTFHGLLPTAAQAPTECIAARQYVVAVAVAAAVDKNISLDALALRHGHYLSHRDVPVLCAALAPTPVRPTNPP